MSLWTPDGEHEVPPDAVGETQSPPSVADGEPLTPEQEEQARAAAQQLSEVRARLLDADVADVVANHALGIYELAAIHITAQEPKLEEARLAIDGLAALVEGLEGRLGQAEPTLRDALHQVRMGFVQRSSAAEQATDQGPDQG